MFLLVLQRFSFILSFFIRSHRKVLVCLEWTFVFLEGIQNLWFYWVWHICLLHSFRYHRKLLLWFVLQTDRPPYFFNRSLCSLFRIFIILAWWRFMNLAWRRIKWQLADYGLFILQPGVWLLYAVNSRCLTKRCCCQSINSWHLRIIEGYLHCMISAHITLLLVSLWACKVFANLRIYDVFALRSYLDVLYRITVSHFLNLSSLFK